MRNLCFAIGCTVSSQIWVYPSAVADHGLQVIWRKQGPPPQTPDATYIELSATPADATYPLIFYRSLKNMDAYSKQVFMAFRVEDPSLSNH